MSRIIWPGLVMMCEGGRGRCSYAAEGGGTGAVCGEERGVWACWGGDDDYDFLNIDVVLAEFYLTSRTSG